MTRRRIKYGAWRGKPLKASLAAAPYMHRATARKEPARPAFDRWKIASVALDYMMRPPKNKKDGPRFTRLPTDPLKHADKRTHNEGPGRQKIKWWLLLDYDPDFDFD